MTALITKKRFRAWLATKGPDEFVGEPEDGETCPIATYLNETHLGFAATVDGDDLVLYAGLDIATEEPTPKWAQAFIRRIDLYRDSVTATTAIRALESTRKNGTTS